MYDVLNESDSYVAFANWFHKPYITACLANFGCIIMTKTYICHNNVGKVTRYKWGAEVLIDRILTGCAGSIYALSQVMMAAL
ncbi:hypothetical protein N9M90_03545 [Alphaproteobacteria bacterium]|nr:hypothetical protein [Alphaproteobacteria bacterium]